MQTTTFITSCLTFDKLKAYSEQTVSKAEQERLYMHVSTCELCACAVNGFSAIPFTSADINRLHKKVDVKSNATIAQPVTTAQVFITILFLLSIIGVYTIADAVSKNHSTVIDAPKDLKSSVKEEKEASNTLIIPTIEHFNKKTYAITQIPRGGIIKEEVINNNAANFLLPMTPKEISFIENTKSDNEEVPFIYNSEVLYIYDLKVTDYDHLYLAKNSSVFNYQNYIPAFNENANSYVYSFSDEEQSITAEKVLKKGLHWFAKSNYMEALENFNLLLENNKNDLNANFYGALCYYNLDKTDRTIYLLNTVLSNTNNTFYPEAQWNLALCYLKQNKKADAKNILQEIIIEKGFYAKKAKEKLKVL